ncbi:MAG: SRPBCC family protein [Acidobacteria bacterium]|nr:SRPBCC family protein [Acidobacteriota bacterium]
MAEKSNKHTLAVTTPSEREIVMTRVFDAPRKLVFDAWTNPKHVPHWLLGPEGWTMPVCEIDLCAGGKWRFVWRNAAGKEMMTCGEFQEVAPPERYVQTERWGGEGPPAINTLLLTEENGKTTVTLTSLYPTKEIRDQVLKSGMTGGVEVSFDRLDNYLRAM